MEQKLLVKIVYIDKFTLRIVQSQAVKCLDWITTKTHIKIPAGRRKFTIPQQLYSTLKLYYCDISQGAATEDEEEAEEGHKHDGLYGGDDRPDDGVDDVEAGEIQIWKSQKRSQTPRLEAGGEATKVEKTAPSRRQIRGEEPGPPEKRCWEGDTDVDPPKSGRGRRPPRHC